MSNNQNAYQSSPVRDRTDEEAYNQTFGSPSSNTKHYLSEGSPSRNPQANSMSRSPNKNDSKGSRASSVYEEPLGVETLKSYSSFLSEETVTFLVKGTNVNIYSRKGLRKLALLSTNPQCTRLLVDEKVEDNYKLLRLVINQIVSIENYDGQRFPQPDDGELIPQNCFMVLFKDPENNVFAECQEQFQKSQWMTYLNELVQTVREKDAQLAEAKHSRANSKAMSDDLKSTSDSGLDIASSLPELVRDFLIQGQEVHILDKETGKRYRAHLCTNKKCGKIYVTDLETGSKRSVHMEDIDDIREPQSPHFPQFDQAEKKENMFWIMGKEERDDIYAEADDQGARNQWVENLNKAVDIAEKQIKENRTIFEGNKNPYSTGKSSIPAEMLARSQDFQKRFSTATQGSPNKYGSDQVDAKRRYTSNISQGPTGGQGSHLKSAHPYPVRRGFANDPEYRAEFQRALDTSPKPRSSQHLVNPDKEIPLHLRSEPQYIKGSTGYTNPLVNRDLVETDVNYSHKAQMGRQNAGTNKYATQQYERGGTGSPYSSSSPNRKYDTAQDYRGSPYSDHSESKRRTCTEIKFSPGGSRHEEAMNSSSSPERRVSEKDLQRDFKEPELNKDKYSSGLSHPSYVPSNYAKQEHERSQKSQPQSNRNYDSNSKAPSTHQSLSSKAYQAIDDQKRGTIAHIGHTTTKEYSDPNPKRGTISHLGEKPMKNQPLIMQREVEDHELPSGGGNNEPIMQRELEDHEFPSASNEPIVQRELRGDEHRSGREQPIVQREVIDDYERVAKNQPPVDKRGTISHIGHTNNRDYDDPNPKRGTISHLSHKQYDSYNSKPGSTIINNNANQTSIYETNQSAEHTSSHRTNPSGGSQSDHLKRNFEEAQNRRVQGNYYYGDKRDYQTQPIQKREISDTPSNTRKYETAQNQPINSTHSSVKNSTVYKGDKQPSGSHHSSNQPQGRSYHESVGRDNTAENEEDRRANAPMMMSFEPASNDPQRLSRIDNNTDDKDKMIFKSEEELNAYLDRLQVDDLERRRLYKQFDLKNGYSAKSKGSNISTPSNYRSKSPRPVKSGGGYDQSYPSNQGVGSKMSSVNGARRESDRSKSPMRTVPSEHQSRRESNKQTQPVRNTPTSHYDLDCDHKDSKTIIIKSDKPVTLVVDKVVFNEKELQRNWKKPEVNKERYNSELSHPDYQPSHYAHYISEKSNEEARQNSSRGNSPNASNRRTSDRDLERNFKSPEYNIDKYHARISHPEYKPSEDALARHERMSNSPDRKNNNVQTTPKKNTQSSMYYTPESTDKKMRLPRDYDDHVFNSEISNKDFRGEAYEAQRRIQPVYDHYEKTQKKAPRYYDNSSPSRTGYQDRGYSNNNQNETRSYNSGYQRGGYDQRGYNNTVKESYVTERVKGADIPNDDLRLSSHSFGNTLDTDAQEFLRKGGYVKELDDKMKNTAFLQIDDVYENLHVKDAEDDQIVPQKTISIKDIQDIRGYTTEKFPKLPEDQYNQSASFWIVGADRKDDLFVECMDKGIAARWIEGLKALLDARAQ